tara:strand:+ start:8462 stop:11836 length:3375 start_codon:yes stop_codon:yes gene_type:complete
MSATETDGNSDADMGWLSDDTEMASETADKMDRRESSRAASISGADQIPSLTPDEDDPTMEYRTLGACVSELLTDDLVSCARARDGVFALGTKSGRVHLFRHSGDFCGHLTRVEPLPRSPHAGPVTDVAFDATGTHVASCALDGTVAVVRLGSAGLGRPAAKNEIVFAREHESPALAAALDPRDADENKYRLIVGLGDGRLIMETFTSEMDPLVSHASKMNGAHRRGDAKAKNDKKMESRVIHKGEGPVRSVAWCGSLVAWANDVGVKVYDVAQQAPVGFIDRPRGSPEAGKYKAHLVWGGTDTLLIGWADCAWVVTIGTRPVHAKWRKNNKATGSRITTDFDSDGKDDETRRYAEVTTMFQTDFAIAGIAPFAGDTLCLLAFLDGDGDRDDDDDSVPSSSSIPSSSSVPPHQTSASSRAPSKRPEVRVYQRAQNNQIIACDALGVDGYRDYKHEDYSLTFALSNDSIPSIETETFQPQVSYFLASPRGVVCARARTRRDKIAGLLSMHPPEFEQALLLCDAGDQKQERDDVAEAYLAYMLAQSLSSDSSAASFFVEKIATSSSRLLRNDPRLWERWVFHCMTCGNPNVLAQLVPYIPTGLPTLPTETYESVLHFLLANKKEHAKFLATLKSWPSSLYGVKGVLAACVRKVAEVVAETRKTSAGMRTHDANDARTTGTVTQSTHIQSSDIQNTQSTDTQNTDTPSTLGTLRESLAELYLADGQPGRALRAHLALGRPTVLDFIERHDLLGLVLASEMAAASESLADAIAPLAALDPERAVALFVARRDVAPPDFIANALAKTVFFVSVSDTNSDEHEDDAYPSGSSSMGSRGAREIYHTYLRALFATDASAVPISHLNNQVGLFAEFHPDELGDFLRDAVGVDLHAALETVRRFETEAAGFVQDEETTKLTNDANPNLEENGRPSHWRSRKTLFARHRASLLSHLGATRGALRALIDLDDIEGAVALVQQRAAPDPDDPLDEGDDELWDELIELVTKRAGALLETDARETTGGTTGGDCSKDSKLGSFELKSREKRARNHGIRDLLDVAGRAVDPSRVLLRVPAGAEIDGLRHRLVNILSERNAGYVRCKLARDTSVALLADARRRRVVSGKRAFRPNKLAVED